MLARKLFAEFFGTFWLVFGGCGSAVISAVYAGPNGVPLGIAFAGVALAFGLTVMTMAYAIGHISGCHLNPAVSLGLVFARRFSPALLLPYVMAQVMGGIVGAGLLFQIASGNPNFNVSGGFACNGFAEHSPGQYTMHACLLAEAVLTFFFLLIIIGSTDRRAPSGFAPLPIGLGLTLIHLIGIPITNLSVNPARSTGPALILKMFGGSADGWALDQLWLFWAAPLAGAALAGLVYGMLFEGDSGFIE